MKLGLINHLSSDGPIEMVAKLEDSLGKLNSDEIPSLVCGPDYGLSLHYTGEPMGLQERQKILQILKKISKQFAQTRLLPGTMLWSEAQKVYLSAPMYCSGRLIREFFKQRNTGESEVARKLNKQFVPGQSKDNWFEFKGKKITYQICGDRADQQLNECFLELIPMLDFQGGFAITPRNDFWNHYAAISNGFDGSTGLYQIQPEKIVKIHEIKPLKKEGNLAIYSAI